MGARPQAGHRNRAARNHSKRTDRERFFPAGALSYCGIVGCIRPISYCRAHPPATERRALSTIPWVATVLCMYALARLIQLAGLTIPPLAIIAQLFEQISLGQMLGFLVVSVGLFMLGYLLQRFSGGQS